MYLRIFRPLKFTFHFKSIVLVAIAFLICGGPIEIAHAGLFEDRAKYKAALSAIRNNQTSTYNRLVKDLEDYPLTPYLQYRRALKDVSRANVETALAYRDQFSDFTFGQRYMAEWLRVQFVQGKWQNYVDNYSPTSNVAAQCRYVTSLTRLGRHQEARSLLPALWSIGKSQDEFCDPAFKPWIRDNGVTDALAWERLEKTLEAQSYQLSRYLFRFFSDGVVRSAQRMYEARRNPSIVSSGSRFKDDQWGNDALIYGLSRLARSNATRARELWEKYRTTRNFSDLQRYRMANDLYLWFALDGQSDLPFHESLSSRTLSRVIHTAISQGDWRQAHQWLESLAPQELELNEWQYWLGRTEEKLEIETWRDRLVEVAKARNYYGFLAADYIGSAPQLNEVAYESNHELETKLRADPRAQIVFEFFAVGEKSNGRTEWRHQRQWMSDSERMVMVHWFNESGLSDEAIFAANNGNLTDFLEVRFPKPFLSYYKKGAFQTDLPLHLLLAISRQESAFDHRAVSVAGARGLMQLMLPTARATAQNNGLSRPSRESLLDPRVNIEIGSHHVAELNEEFHGNRVLIAMSYNAGKHNTYKWLKRFNVSDTISFIEIIPYGETREYVKGVLAFALVYAMRQGDNPELLADKELTIHPRLFN